MLQERVKRKWYIIGMVTFTPEEFSGVLNSLPLGGTITELLTNPSIAGYGLAFLLILIVALAVAYWSFYIASEGDLVQPAKYSVFAIFFFWMLVSTAPMSVYFYPTHYNPREDKPPPVKTEVENVPIAYNFLEIGDLLALNLVRLFENYNYFIAHSYLTYCYDPKGMVAQALYHTVKENYSTAEEIAGALASLCNDEEWEKYRNGEIGIGDIRFNSFRLFGIPYGQGRGAEEWFWRGFVNFAGDFKTSLQNLVAKCRAELSGNSEMLNKYDAVANRLLSMSVDDYRAIAKETICREMPQIVASASFEEYGIKSGEELTYHPLLKEGVKNQVSQVIDKALGWLFDIGVFTAPTLKLVLTGYKLIVSIVMILFPFLFLLSLIPDEDSVLGFSWKRLMSLMEAYVLVKLTIPAILFIQFIFYNDYLEQIANASTNEILKELAETGKYKNIMFQLTLIAITGILWAKAGGSLIHGIVSSFTEIQGAFNRLKALAGGKLAPPTAQLTLSTAKTGVKGAVATVRNIKTHGVISGLKVTGQQLKTSTLKMVGKPRVLRPYTTTKIGFSP